MWGWIPYQDIFHIRIRSADKVLIEGLLNMVLF